MAKEESKLEKLKKEYAQISKRYDLPSFKQLNEDFGIEELAEKETELLAKKIRLIISGKISGALRFLELFLNPSGAPLFILSALKGINTGTKKLIEKVYEELTKIEIISLNLDMGYSDQNEAKFIKDVAEKWLALKEDIGKISKALGEALDIEGKTKRDYFG